MKTTIAVLAALAACASAHAVPIGVTSLNGAGATAYATSGVNPNQGPNGNTSGFSAAFASYGSGDWLLVGKATGDVAGQTAQFGARSLTWSVDVQGANAGVWSIQSNVATQLDLVLAVHASNASGAWLFNDVVLEPVAPENGTFQISWTNNGGKIPDFSNATLFARDLRTPASTSVPEPTSLALLLAGAGMMAWSGRRKRAG